MYAEVLGVGKSEQRSNMHYQQKYRLGKPIERFVSSRREPAPTAAWVRTYMLI
jgi:hypothetical protein